MAVGMIYDYDFQCCWTFVVLIEQSLIQTHLCSEGEVQDEVGPVLFVAEAVD